MYYWWLPSNVVRGLVSRFVRYISEDVIIWCIYHLQGNLNITWHVTYRYKANQQLVQVCTPAAHCEMTSTHIYWHLTNSHGLWRHTWKKYYRWIGSVKGKACWKSFHMSVRISSTMHWLNGISVCTLRLSIHDSINHPSKLIFGFQSGQCPRGKFGWAAMNAIQNALQPQIHSGACTVRTVPTSQHSSSPASLAQLASDMGSNDGKSGKKGNYDHISVYWRASRRLRFMGCHPTYHVVWKRLYFSTCHWLHRKITSNNRYHPPREFLR